MHRTTVGNLGHDWATKLKIFRYNSDDGGKYSASEEGTFSRTSKSRVRLAVSEIKPVQTDKQTDGQTDKIVNYSNSRCACARGLTTTLPLHIR